MLAASRALGPATAKFHYALKANEHPEVMRTLLEHGISMECVSLAEIEHVRATLGAAAPVLFTPNFCPVEEYSAAYALGATVTIDGPEILAQAPEVFRGREVALRVDPGRGRGHHEKVRSRRWRAAGGGGRWRAAGGGGRSSRLRAASDTHPSR